ncbi:WD40-repeat-containing domain protein [Cokeromyces recurvatus]|uniref:WD40-repeat-containing domain protein n=1 Tax=Cokeromyces recurvatus TaxID=90255 RepID=UPI00221E98DE|nr:WD40-repeat-containing domain protein [Cokeromyces recurvatus]KAI7901461.1 WD40-repeat-containing domain protein [Cokeromyces recurvatus]
MSIACHPNLPVLISGINSSEENIKQGINLNCQIFDIENGQIQFKSKFSTSTCRNPEEYQKITRFSRSGNYLVTGISDGRISVLKKTTTSTTQWELCFPSLRFMNVQDIAIDHHEEHVAIAVSSALIILSIHDGTIVQVIDSPKLNKHTTCEIHACRYGYSSKNQQETLYAVINPISTRGKGFICAWKLRESRSYPVNKAKTAGISRKSITTFTVNPTGDILAYASTDLSIGLVDAQTLKPILRIPKAHGFAITNLCFNPSGRYLASAGADNNCRVMILPESINLTHKKYQAYFIIESIFMILDMLLFALLVHIIVQWTL